MSRIQRLIWLVCLLALMTCNLKGNGLVHSKTPESCPERKLVTKIGRRVIASEAFTATKSLVTIRRSTAKHLRARIVLGSNAGCDWNLTVRDVNYHVIQTLAPADFESINFRWTARVPGTAINLDLRRCKNGVTPDLKYDEYIEVASEQSLDSYYSAKNFNAPDYQNLYPPTLTADNVSPRYLGDYVGFIMGSYREETWGCSGVMIRSDLFLTNWHCGRPSTSDLPLDQTWKQEIWQNAIIDLSWDDDSISREYYVVERVALLQDLDYALLRVLPITNSGVPRYSPINQSQMTVNQPLTIVHHPRGLRKQVSSTQCSVVNRDFKGWFGTADTDFTHRCDTESGSSGAPVFNSRGELVGLHHIGFEYDSSCQADGLNKAVKIQKIISDIQRQRPDVIIPGLN